MPPHFAIPGPPVRRQIRLATMMRAIVLVAAACWMLGPRGCFAISMIVALVIVVLTGFGVLILAFFGFFMALGWLGFAAAAIFERARISRAPRSSGFD